MKRIVLVCALALLAQGVSAQSRWGLRTGLNYNLNGIELNQALNSAQGIFEGQTQDDGYHLGVFGRQFLGDQLFASGSLLYGKDMQFITHTVDGVSTNARFDNQFVQLDAGLGIRLLKTDRAEGGIHFINAIGNTAYSQTFESPSAGYNLAIGVDLWKLSVDLTYYSSLQNHQGDWNGIPLSYERSQLMLSVGAKL
jgi:hypothetical protein